MRAAYCCVIHALAKPAHKARHTMSTKGQGERLAGRAARLLPLRRLRLRLRSGS